MAVDNIEKRIQQLSSLTSELYRLGITAENELGDQLRHLALQLRDVSGFFANAVPLNVDTEEQIKLARFAANTPGFFFTLARSAAGHWSMPFASAAIRDTLGIEPESVAEDIAPLAAITHPEDVDMAFQSAEASVRDLGPHHLEYRICHPQKGVRWIESRSMPHRDADGNTVWHGFMQDVTQRKITENTLRFIAQRQDMTDAEDFPVALAHHLATVLNLDYVLIDRITDDPDVAETVALYTRNGLQPNLSYPLAHTPCANVMGQRMCAYPTNVQTLFPKDYMLVDMGVDSYVGVPLWDAQGKAIGLIAVLDGKPMGDVELVKQILQLAAPAASAALKLARSERELRERARQLTSLAEHLPIVVARVDLQIPPNILYVNPLHVRLVGSTKEEVNSRMSAEDQAEMEVMMAQVSTTGQPQKTRISIRQDDGEIQIHDVSIIAERDESQRIVSLLLLGQDVTDHVRTQEALKASEYHFRSLADNLPDNICRWDTGGRYLYVNPTAVRTIDRSPEQLLGSRVSQERYDDLFMALAFTANAGKSTSLRQTILDNGQERLHEIRLIPERDAQGKVTSILGIGRDITEQVRLQEALTESERQFRSLAEHSTDSVVRWDCTRRILYLNPAHERILGKPAKELIGTFSDDVKYPEIARAVEQAAATGETIPFTRQTVVNGKGESRVHEVSIIPERNDKGEIVSILGIGRDITEQVRTQEALTASELQFRSLADNLPLNVARWDCDGYFIYSNPMHQQTLGRSAEEIIGTQMPPQHAKDIQETAVTGAPRYATYLMPSQDGSTRIHEVDLVPERDERGKVVSVLGIGRDITDQVRLQQALRASESQFRSLAENMPDNVARFDLEGRYLYLNPVHAETMGKPIAEILGSQLPRDYRQVWNAFETIVATGEGIRGIREQVFKPDGRIEVHEINMIPEWDSDGRIVSLLGIGRDITEQVRLQEALIASGEQFRSLAENLPDNVARWDLDGRYVYVNPIHARTLDTTADAIIGTLLPNSHSNVAAALKRVRTTGKGEFNVRQEVTDEDGATSIHEVSIIPERGPDGAIVSFLGLGRDVTQQARLQESLSISERQFRSLAENLPNNVIRYGRDGRIIYVNPAAERTLGQPLEKLIGTAPHQRPQFKFHKEYERRIADASRGISSEMEVYAQTAEGKEGWFVLNFCPEWDSSGRIVSILAISHDITARKNAEFDLRMAASVFNAANEAIVITDPEGRLLRVNPAFSRITGYFLDDVTTLSPVMLGSSRNSDSFYEEILQSLAERGQWSGDVDACRRGGEGFTARLSISAAHNGEGEVLYYVGIFSDISHLKRHEIQLQYIAHHDTLTGLPNRVLLVDRMNQAIAQARRNGTLLAVLFIDLDGFKPINDRFGHKAGDHTLVEMALRMANMLRAGDTVARIGGDEFIVLLPGLTEPGECEHSTRRLLKAIAEPTEVDGNRFTLSASIGIALYPDHADDSDSLLRRADEAMYVAKRTGRNQYVFCDGTGQMGGRLDGNLVHDLRIALEQNQIEVHYQPIVDFATGRVTKAEALVRWRHPERGLISPAEFIPIAEDSGLIHAIGNQVFAQAVTMVQEWNRHCQIGGLRRISVNRSPREFLDPSGADDWMALLRKQDGDVGRMLVVEITEGLLLDDRPKVLEQLQQLRAAGMTIALDDFGTGFSSLAYLKKFDIDYIKIDRSFVLDIVHDASDRVIVESVIAMGRHLGIKLIAEGVETESQAGLLATAGCDYAQGYFYARPMPAREFLDFVGEVEGIPLAVPLPSMAVMV